MRWILQKKSIMWLLHTRTPQLSACAGLHAWRWVTHIDRVIRFHMIMLGGESPTSTESPASIWSCLEVSHPHRPSHPLPYDHAWRWVTHIRPSHPLPYDHAWRWVTHIRPSHRFHMIMLGGGSPTSDRVTASIWSCLVVGHPHPTESPLPYDHAWRWVTHIDGVTRFHMIMLGGGSPTSDQVIRFHMIMLGGGSPTSDWVTASIWSCLVVGHPHPTESPLPYDHAWRWVTHIDRVIRFHMIMLGGESPTSTESPTSHQAKSAPLDFCGWNRPVRYHQLNIPIACSHAKTGHDSCPVTWSKWRVFAAANYSAGFVLIMNHHSQNKDVREW